MRDSGIDVPMKLRVDMPPGFGGVSFA